MVLYSPHEVAHGRLPTVDELVSAGKHIEEKLLKNISCFSLATWWGSFAHKERLTRFSDLNLVIVYSRENEEKVVELVGSLHALAVSLSVRLTVWPIDIWSYEHISIPMEKIDSLRSVAEESGFIAGDASVLDLTMSLPELGIQSGECVEYALEICKKYMSFAVGFLHNKVVIERLVWDSFAVEMINSPHNLLFRIASRTTFSKTKSPPPQEITNASKHLPPEAQVYHQELSELIRLYQDACTNWSGGATMYDDLIKAYSTLRTQGVEFAYRIMFAYSGHVLSEARRFNFP